MKIGILGCGYIGQAAAKYWKAKGHEVSVTTRDSTKIEFLSSMADHVYCLERESLEQFLKNQETLIIAVAPGHKAEYSQTYLGTANKIVQFLPQLSSLRQLIYTSSTSVYGECHGDWMDENRSPFPLNEQAQILLETENIFLSCRSADTKVCIYRLGEIYGPGRQIVNRLKRMSSHSLPGNGENFTNMIHQQDVVNALDFALNRELDGLFNLCNDFHIPRRELYERLCLEHGLKPIQWDASLKSFHGGNKRITNDKLKKLGFEFVFPEFVFEERRD